MPANTALPLAPDEPKVIATLDRCAPEFARRVTQLMDALRAQGWQPIITESLRTKERQAWLYGIGRAYRTADGRAWPVTNADTGYTSWHFYGLAVDMIDKVSRWDEKSAFWADLGEQCEQLGLEWGGWWKKPDRPHVQFGPPMRKSPSQRAREIYQTGGLEAVWEAVKAA